MCLSLCWKRMIKDPPRAEQCMASKLENLPTTSVFMFQRGSFLQVWSLWSLLFARRSVPKSVPNRSPLALAGPASFRGGARCRGQESRGLRSCEQAAGGLRRMWCSRCEPPGSVSMHSPTPSTSKCSKGPKTVQEFERWTVRLAVCSDREILKSDARTWYFQQVAGLFWHKAVQES